MIVSVVIDKEVMVKQIEGHMLGKKLTINEMARTFVIGDVHGGLSELKLALDSAGVTSADTVIFMGDLINKRHQNLEVLRFIKQRPNTHCLLGNHEYFFVQYFYHQAHYFKEQIVSVGGQWCFDADPNLMFEYAAWMEDNFRCYFELDCPEHSIGLVHAEVACDDWAEMKRDEFLHFKSMLFGTRRYNQWLENGELPLIKGVDLVIAGHIPVKHATCIGNVLYIDTGSYFEQDYYNEGEISCLSLAEALLKWEKENASNG
jgi:serine/threonine protein phosphatase 1